HKSRVIRIADLEIDTGSHRVTRGGQEIILTPREYSLLESLAANQGRPLSRDVILQRVWMDDDSYSNTVDVHVGSLRKKIDSGYEEKLIHTIHGIGYCLKRDTPEPKG
nr:winged helix-turn-helix domain-containing protein [Armatimonadota bacterium]